MNIKQMRTVVKELKNASRMHAQQAKKIEGMIIRMNKKKSNAKK
tara:strand:+ start:2437 stop:2568 length:132 start_codon:yes stop_codon:yes gene_type:complete